METKLLMKYCHRISSGQPSILWHNQEVSGHGHEKMDSGVHVHFTDMAMDTKIFEIVTWTCTWTRIFRKIVTWAWTLTRNF